MLEWRSSVFWLCAPHTFFLREREAVLNGDSGAVTWPRLIGGPLSAVLPATTFSLTVVPVFLFVNTSNRGTQVCALFKSETPSLVRSSTPTPRAVVIHSTSEEALGRNVHHSWHTALCDLQCDEYC